MPTRRTLRLVAATLSLLVVCSVVAEAQSPPVPTLPRSNGGRAARFGSGGARGTAKSGGAGQGVGGQIGSLGAMNGSRVQPGGRSRAGSRPANGALAPSKPMMGGGPSSGSRSGQVSGSGVQIFSADQIKAGAGQPISSGWRGR